jgi:hypothetical protein
MNPAEPHQFDKIMKSLEVLYRTVDNADGFGMIDCHQRSSQLIDNPSLFSSQM